MRTPYPTTEAEALALLAHPLIEVQTAEVPPEPCPWCDDIAAVTTVRIYGRPRRDAEHQLDLVEVCGMCAPRVALLAIAERDGDAPLVVEINP